MRMYITVQFELEGVHRYLSAPDEVDFLRHYHRHMFHIGYAIQVFHDDRELEFIMVKRRLKDACAVWFRDNMQYSSFSCEFIARALQNMALQLYPHTPRRLVDVEVMEDGENGVQLVDDEEDYPPRITKTDKEA